MATVNKENTKGFWKTQVIIIVGTANIGYNDVEIAGFFVKLLEILLFTLSTGGYLANIYLTTYEYCMVDI